MKKILFVLSLALLAFSFQVNAKSLKLGDIKESKSSISGGHSGPENSKPEVSSEWSKETFGSMKHENEGGDFWKKVGGKHNEDYDRCGNDDDEQQPAQTPIPAAVWLFGSALLGLTGIIRRKQA